MPDFHNSKIYKLWSPQTDEIYIGSTTQVLAVRLAGHKRDYKCWKNGKSNYITSFELFEENDDVRIELLEEYSCENRDQLNKKEGEYIRSLNCLNRCIAGRSIKEWWEDNKEQNNDKKKDYYENNKEEILEKHKEKVKCGCGSVITKSNLAKHKKTQKHQDYEKQLENELNEELEKELDRELEQP